MNAAMKVAAKALANAADLAVFALFHQAQITISKNNITENNIIDAIIDARTTLYSNNVNDGTEIFLEVSPKIAGLILKSKIKLSTDNGETLETGCIGSIAGCKVFVSQNIAVEDVGTGITHHCCMRTKHAVAFAEQLSEIEAYRPEKRFSDAIKGLHLYGVKIVYPKEYITLDLTFPND